MVSDSQGGLQAGVDIVVRGPQILLLRKEDVVQSSLAASRVSPRPIIATVDLIVGGRGPKLCLLHELNEPFSIVGSYSISHTVLHRPA